MRLFDIEFNNILDIGANVGEWSANARIIWPDAHIEMIEANPGCEYELKQKAKKLGNANYTIALLGDESKESVLFYTLDSTATGASVYKEIGTALYEDVAPIVLPQTTLDTLFKNQAFELIKIDTQGSEVDIIIGGLTVVDKASHVILEVSTKPYNEGSPLEKEVVDFMRSIGFHNSKMMIDYSHCNQKDVIFWRS